jgi:hypothetical protein
MRRFKSILLKGERYKVLYYPFQACDECDLSKYCIRKSDGDNTMLDICCNLGIPCFKKEKDGYGDGDARKQQDG